jgi:hypothetical protein
MLRKKVLAGEMTDAEARVLLHGKSPLEAQGKIPKWPTPRTHGLDGGAGARSTIERLRIDGVITAEECRVAMGAGRGGWNPEFQEWLMGFDRGWTALEPSATPSSRKSRKSSGGSCAASTKG